MERARLSTQDNFWLAAILCVAVSSNSLPAQGSDLSFKNGDSVVVLVPISLTNPQTAGFWQTQVKLDIEARSVDGAVEILDPDSKIWRRDWRTAGFPSPSRYKVTGKRLITRGKGKAKFLELTLNLKKDLDVRLFAPVDQVQALRVIVAPTAAADSAMKVAYDTLGAQFFTGPLASFTPEERVLILQFAHLTASGTKIASETFKGITYLTVSLPGETSTWNDLVVTKSKRVGRLIGEQLPLLKAFAKISLAHKGIGGLKLVQPSRHGTAPSYTDARVDHVMAYFPIEVMLKFAQADMTSQQLVNQSIILVNDDRVEVDLSSQ